MSDLLRRLMVGGALVALALSTTGCGLTLVVPGDSESSSASTQTTSSSEPSADDSEPDQTGSAIPSTEAPSSAATEADTDESDGGEPCANGETTITSSYSTLTLPKGCTKVTVEATSVTLKAEALDTLTINTNYATVTITSAKKVVVNGNSNTVKADSISGSVTIDGKYNTVRHTTGTPTVSQNGSSNTVGKR